ncbi:MAG: TolC family outer membrane protein, partial [Gammaproteobacteria bacterium]|nr:TolC family outer membrane protein [Gammaproteobacteria bacterium]
MRKAITLLPVAALLVSGLASADTLLQVYEKAMRSDPLIREAEANMLATQEGKPIARGALLPQVNGRMNFAKTGASGTSTTFFGTGQSTRVIDSRDSDARNWNLELRQSVFRWDQWVRLSQAGKQSAQADVDYQSAQQDLVIRVAEAYFRVLAAEDTLASEQAAKDAIGRQLEQAQKRFEVGLIAITDVQEAQAAYDQALAAEILAKRVLANQQELLRAIIDEAPPRLAKPVDNLPLEMPDPADENQWVDLAMQQNRSLISSQIGVEIAKDDVSVARTGHYPTLDFVVGRNNTDNEGFSRSPCSIPTGCRDPLDPADPSDPPTLPLDPFGTIQRNPTGTDLENDSLSLQFAIPIFSGGTTSARVQQAVYLHRASRERLERTARETERQTRDAYLGVITDISRVQALKQAFESAKTALKATEAGYDVGTRTTVDVLDARRSVFIAETVYLRSRYDYLINSLRLKQAAGTLTTDDIAQIDNLLTTASAAPEPAA